MSKCELCGEPMPEGETMFKFHGYSGPCQKPPMQPTSSNWIKDAAAECASRVLVGGGEKMFEAIIARHFSGAQRTALEAR